MKKKIIALILCICLISCTCIQPAYAMGAEGIIVGGGAAAAGVTLTMPQVALLVAAGFGLVYATQHAEEIYRGLDTALTNAANNIDGGIEQLSTWTAQAAQGEIAIASAPNWIVDTIKSWVTGLYDSYELSNAPSLGLTEVQSNQPVAGPLFWHDNPTTYKFNKPVTVLRASTVKELYIDKPYYSLMSFFVAVSKEAFSGSSTTTINGTKCYYKYYSSSSTVPRDKPLEGDNLAMYNALVGLPNYDAMKSKYTKLTSSSDVIISGWLDGLFSPASGSICPDEIVGGIEGALDVGGIDNIKVPDLDIGGSGLLAPDKVGTGSVDDVLNDILTRLKQQELSWSDYMTDVAVGNPSITIEGKEYVIDDTGVTDIPVEDVVPDNPPADGVVVPEGLEPFTMSLTDFFPFCIPFDIADFVNVLCAEPEAPRFDWTFTWYGGDTDTLTIDLSPFDQVAQLLRNMELLLFCIGLALITRNQIRG